MISLEASQAHCRGVAKRRARNFYYSFVLLSPERKNAMCAVYAFMRYCDDLSDEPGATRTAMDRWREALTEAFAGRPDSSPVWPAFIDAVSRYKIPHEYFYDMIEGVASDLTPRTFHKFDELYQYCYRVASVVGLTTIHIFGFDSPEALPLAEKCGIAFQLTNILRDVKEDVERGRVYLPIDLLDEFGENIDELRELAAGRGITERERGMLATLAIRAEKYYLAANRLIPLLDRDSRAAMWVLVTIYHRLLGRIADRRMEVFRERIGLSTAEKLRVFARGAMMAAWNRVAG